MRVLLRGLLVGTVGFLLAGVAANADRPATKRERTQILRAAHRQSAGPGCRGYPHGHCRERVRVSTVRSSWAAVGIGPSSKQYEGEVQRDVVSMHRRRGRWRLHQEGNGGGCNMPAAVRRDLRLACY